MNLQDQTKMVIVSYKLIKCYSRAKHSSSAYSLVECCVIGVVHGWPVQVRVRLPQRKSSGVAKEVFVENSKTWKAGN